MTTTVFNSDGSTLAVLADGMVDSTTTSLSLPGRGYVSYGSIICSDLVALLENFANDVAPNSPQIGQLWFRTKYNDHAGDSTEYNRLLVYTGQESSDTLDPNDPNNIVPTGWTDVGTKIYTNLSGPVVKEIGDIWFKKTSTTGEFQQFFWNGSEWARLGGLQISENAPLNSDGISAPLDGTLWWMIPEGIMWVYDSAISNPNPPFWRTGGSNNGNQLTGGWRQIGPQAPVSVDASQYWMAITDTSNNSHNVLIEKIDNKIVSVTSENTFTMGGSKTISGFGTYSNPHSPTNTNIITSGLNLNNSVGCSITGTVSNATYFENNVPSDFLGRGNNPSGNYTAAPSYPFSDAATDFGTSGNRWNNNYSIRYYASNFTSGNMASTSSPNWGEIDFIGNASSSVNSQYLEGLQPSSFIGRGGSGDPATYPKNDNSTDLGTSGNRWRNLYATSVSTSTLTSSTVNTTNTKTSELNVSDTGNIQKIKSTTISTSSISSTTFSGGTFYGSGYGPNNIPTTTNYNTTNFIGNAYSSSFSNQANHASSASKWDNNSSLQISGDVVSSSQSINANGSYNFSTSISQNGCSTVKNYLLSNNVFVTPNTFNNEVSHINGEIQSINQTDANLQSEINNINSNIGRTGDQAGSNTVYGAINRNVASIATINGEINSINQTDESLQSQINSIKTGIGTTNDANGANTVYGAINKHTSDINNINSEIQKIDQIDNTFSGQISDIYGRIGNTNDAAQWSGSIYSHINANASGINNINAEISQIRATDVSLQNQITANKIGRMLFLPQIVYGKADGTGTITVPVGSATRYLRVYGCGGGGAGGSAWYPGGSKWIGSAGSGGGAGASTDFWVDVAAAGISGSVVLIAGQGGAPNTDSSQSSGGAGGSSYFNGGNITIMLGGGSGGPHDKSAGQWGMAGQGGGGLYSVNHGNGLEIVWIKGGATGTNAIVLNSSPIPTFGGHSPWGSGGYNSDHATGGGSTGYGSGGGGGGADISSNNGSAATVSGAPGEPGMWVIEQYS